MTTPEETGTPLREFAYVAEKHGQQVAGAIDSATAAEIVIKLQSMGYECLAVAERRPRPPQIDLVEVAGHLSRGRWREAWRTCVLPPAAERTRSKALPDTSLPGTARLPAGVSPATTEAYEYEIRTYNGKIIRRRIATNDLLQLVQQIEQSGFVLTSAKRLGRKLRVRLYV